MIIYSYHRERRDMMSYCNWCRGNPIMEKYHECEWGVPVYDDNIHFEYLMLEAMQCGLSWETVMNKRQTLKECFSDFDYKTVANYTNDDIERIYNTDGMIRSLPKIKAVINNAECFKRTVEEYGSFYRYIEGFSGGVNIVYNCHPEGCIPAENGLSARISKDLRARGFKYLGPVTVYAYLQACGVVNDHSRDCPCFERISSKYSAIAKKRNKEKCQRWYR